MVVKKVKQSDQSTHSPRGNAVLAGALVRLSWQQSQWTWSAEGCWRAKPQITTVQGPKSPKMNSSQHLLF